MEESSAQCQGILSPKLNDVQALKTPIVTKTRSTILKRSDTDNEDLQQVTQTPRRSTRKSVRPPKDYYDIMRSASKRKPEIPIDDNENQEDEPVKKNKSEVGRKRNAKRKARKNKTGKVNNADEVTDQHQKKEHEEEENKKPEKKEQEEEENEQREKEQVGKDVTETTEKKEENMDQQHQRQDLEIEQQLKEEEDQKTEQQQKREEDQETDKQQNMETEVIQKKEQEENEVAKKQDIDPLLELVSSVKNSPKQEQDKTAKEQGSPVGEPSVSPGLIIISDDEQKLSTDQEKPLQMEVNEGDDFDELGLKPLNRDEEQEEDMPSLILLDDEMGEEHDDDVLNRTFDAEPEDAVEQPETENSQKPEPVAAIKIVLTDSQDQKSTILNPNNNSILVTNKPKAFKFPTPLKANSKPNLMFSVANTSARKTQLALYNKELEDSCSIRRRSKSFTDFTETRNKTVTIFSPIEVMSTADIDKRWNCLDVSNVTQRRRRSKSLDSRIPKPKFEALTKSNTPGKLKARKKVPNFAAIHQKQFDNMENLEEHIERKKARAKELTASALKQLSRVESVQKKVPAAAADRSARPKAVRKIDIPANAPKKRMVALTPMKVDGIPRQNNEMKIKSRLPLPTLSKVFTSTSAPAVPSQPADGGLPLSLQDKVEARRQRHMDMFKGRTIKEKNTNIIRGVRSNRRFELQMKHRQQLEEKKI